MRGVSSRTASRDAYAPIHGALTLQFAITFQLRWIEQVIDAVAAARYKVGLRCEPCLSSSSPAVESFIAAAAVDSTRRSNSTQRLHSLPQSYLSLSARPRPPTAMASKLAVSYLLNTGDSPRARRNQCSRCGHCFAQSADLRKHVRTVHEGQRPFGCDQCGKRFGERGNLSKVSFFLNFCVRKKSAYTQTALTSPSLPSLCSCSAPFLAQEGCPS